MSQDQHMNQKWQQQIHQHLTRLKSAPKVIDNGPEVPGISWDFTLSPGIHGELICQPDDDNTATLILIIPADMPEHEELDAFALVVAPAIAPFSIMSLSGQLSLRLVIRTDASAAIAQINEAIILSRHITKAVFTGALALGESKADFNAALAQTIKVLQSGNTADG